MTAQRWLGGRLTAGVVACAATIGVLSVATAATPSQSESDQVFRARTEVVLVDVSVLNDRMPAVGLTPADFEISDNGVTQTVEQVMTQALPLDVSLVIDASGSVSSVLDQLTLDASRIAASLRPGDQIRVVTFGSTITLSTPLQPVNSPITHSARPALGGSTALNDALLYALVQPTAPGRRQIVVAMTDGLDNASWLDADRLPLVARGADPVLNVVLAGRPPELLEVARLLSGLSEEYPEVWRLSGLDLKPLILAAHTTGGEVYQANGTTGLIPTLLKIIDDFRRGYLLAYTPTRVPQGGWHNISIKVPKFKKYVVHARTSYYAEKR